MLGVVVGTAAVVAGPMVPDAHDLAAVLSWFAGTDMLLHLHGLGVAVGTLLLLVGFHALANSFEDVRARWWASAGMAAAVVMAAVHLLGPTLGGAVLPALAAEALAAQAAAAQAATQQAIALNSEYGARAAAFRGAYVMYEALLAPSLLTAALTTALFARALIASGAYPRWLGWAGLVPAGWCFLGAVVFHIVGPLEAAAQLMRFMPGFMLMMLWVFAVGAMMRRVASLGPRRTALAP
jgi:hypothetical protein